MRKTLLLLFLLGNSITPQAQTSEPLKSWSPEPLEDSVKKYDKAWNFNKALIFVGQWLEKTSKNPGKDSLDFAAALFYKGNVLRKANRAKEAEPVILKGLQLRKKALGSMHADVGASLNSLGLLSWNTGNFTKALTEIQESLEIRKKTLGPEHPLVAGSINNLAVMYQEIGDYPKALLHFRNALEIRKKTLGPESPDVAATLNNLADIYQIMNEYANALPLYLQAMELRRKALGPEHAEVANSVNNLGVLYMNMGEYSKAERFLQQAFEIRKKVLAPDHSDLANTVNNLGVLYMNVGDYSKAEPCFLQALQSRKKSFGPEHLAVGGTLHNLGVLYFELGAYAKAESYYLQALEIRKKTTGTEHSDAGATLDNLGLLYMQKGEYSRAEPLFLQAMEIRKKALKTDSTELARSLINLGNLFSKRGDYTKAEAHFLNALEIRKKALGWEHPDLAFSLNKLGTLYRSQKKTAEAAVSFEEVSDLDRKLIHRYFPAMSEQGREAYLKNGQGGSEELKSFLSEEGVNNPALRGELWNHQLFYKGLLLNTRARWKQRLNYSKDTTVLRFLGDWINLQYKISGLFSSTNSAGRTALDSLVEKAEKLEKELSRRSEDLAFLEERKVSTWQEVQQALKPGEAAVELVRFRHFGIEKVTSDTTNPRKPTYLVQGLTDTVQYAALILTKNSLHPDLVILPNGNDLEDKWFKHYRKSIRLLQKDGESYRQYWNPIGSKLKGIKKVWFSADGVYHKVNPVTFQNPATGKFLVDEIEIALLSSCKDLLKKHPEESGNRLACLLGNPAFQPAQQSNTTENFRSGQNQKAPALPGSQAEIALVAGLLIKKGWEVQEYTGAGATEEKVKDMYKPRVLLLSTHGFFRPDSTVGSNPLLRSGILLSGSAKTLRDGHKGEGEDGILTSYEAMNLNLDNTELVVLSACETGLGEIKNGEGVYGLQRAFQVAGARNVVMSLWKVDDAVTQKLMVAFFRNWTSGMEKRAAFLKAQKDLQKKYPNPYYWGAFVMVGE